VSCLSVLALPTTPDKDREDALTKAQAVMDEDSKAPPPTPNTDEAYQVGPNLANVPFFLINIIIIIIIIIIISSPITTTTTRSYPPSNRHHRRAWSFAASSGAVWPRSTWGARPGERRKPPLKPQCRRAPKGVAPRGPRSRGGCRWPRRSGAGA
jgi:hypothetical protein